MTPGSTRAILPPATIGIIGGGQLGRMMTQKAKRLGFHVGVLDPAPGAPAAQVADFQVVGGFHDAAKLDELTARCAVSTYDIEHIDAEALAALEARGRVIRPSAALLGLIQDKLRQRQRLAEAGIPQPKFAACDEPGAQAFAAFGYPLVQKLRRGGYDGRGVAVIESPAELSRTLAGPSIVERRVDIEKELAAVVARGLDGQMRAYPLVEMEFDSRANVLDLLLAPARVPAETARRAEEIALATVEALGGVGVFGVELFWTKSGEVLVNEVAPRPHNSAHYTYEACLTSQFEQHIRAVTGLPLGSPAMTKPAAMANLLGAPDGGEGPAEVDGLEEALRIDGVLVHLYGKAETRPFRKMGHVTALADTLDEARAKALRARNALRIRAGGGR